MFKHKKINFLPIIYIGTGVLIGATITLLIKK